MLFLVLGLCLTLAHAHLLCEHVFMSHNVETITRDEALIWPATLIIQ